MEHGKNLVERIDGEPKPQDLFGAAEPRAQLVQLQVRQVEVAEAVLVQGPCMFPCASQPCGDGGLPVAEDPLGRGSIQPLSQCRQHQGDLLGGGFQAIQRGVASGSERRVTGLASKRLDTLSAAMGAISYQSVDSSVGDAKVRAVLVRTGEAPGVDSLRCSPPAFHLAPGTYRRSRRLST